MFSNQSNEIQNFVKMRLNKEPLTAPAPVFTSTVSLITNTEMNLNLKYIPYLNGSFVINQYLGNTIIANVEPSNVLTIGNNTTVNTVHYMNLEPKTQYYYNIFAKSANTNPNIILLDKQSNILATTKNIQPVITAVPTTNNIKFTWSSTLVPKQNYVFNMYIIGTGYVIIMCLLCVYMCLLCISSVFSCIYYAFICVYVCSRIVIMNV